MKRKDGKLLVYLADLDHFGFGNQVSIPLNIASIASYCNNLYGKETDILLFKNPKDLIQQIRHNPPDILGLSFYMWNVNLTLKLAEYSKSINQNTVTVIGGANVARISGYYTPLLNKNPDLDIIVLDQGEKSFSNIMHRILSKDKGGIFSEDIPGCAIRLKDTAKVIRGKIVMADKEFFNGLPSPYLGGYLDRFLKAGFLPLLETTRGCPYSCTYCREGDPFFSKLYVKDERLVKEELLYIYKHSRTCELCITDSNFGIMGDRDERIALFIVDLYKRHGFPSFIDIGTSKIKSEQSIRIMKILANINGYFYFGLQTLTEEVLKNCDRKNIPIDMIESLASSAKAENLATSVDLIFGLPRETTQTFFETISKLLNLGIDQPVVYNLRLFPGTELSENGRGKYQYKTRFRPFNNRYGEYELLPGEKPARIIEAEEIAYENSSFDKNDYMLVRKYSFLTELLVCYGILYRTFGFLNSIGINFLKVFEFILKDSCEYPELTKLFSAYDRLSRDELFESEKDLIDKICKDNTQWDNLIRHNGEYFKINLGLAGYCIFENYIIFEDIESIIKRSCENLSSDQLRSLNHVIEHDRSHRIIINKKEGRLEKSDIKKEIVIEELFDYRKWIATGYKGNLRDYKYPAPIPRKYYINRYDDLIRAVDESSAFSGFNFYERILMRIARVDLKRVGSINE